MAATSKAYGAFCKKCGLLAGSSKNEDFYQEILDEAADHLAQTPHDGTHRVHIRELIRTWL